MLRKVFLALTIILAFFCATNNQPLRAQDAPIIRLTACQQNLGEVLEKFQQQSGIRLVFANSMMDSPRISVQIADSPAQALQRILHGTPFDYIQPNHSFWVIVPRAQKLQTSASISGNIFDALTRLPLADTYVFLPSAGLDATTNAQGYFTINRIPGKPQKLIVKRIGYQDSTLDLSLHEKFPANLQLALQPKFFVVPDIVVEGKRLPKALGGHLLQQTLADDQLKLSPLRNDGDIFELLHQQPGVSRRDLQDVFPHIEGGSATEVAVELDGMPIFVPTYGENRRSIFAAPSLANITLWRSGYGAEYGEAMSGIVALQTLNPDQIAYSTRLSLSRSGVSLGLKKNSSHFGWLGIGRSANFDESLTIDELKAHDLFNKLEYKISPQKALTLLSLVSTGALTQSNSHGTEKIWSYNAGMQYHAQTDSSRDLSLLWYRSELLNHQQEIGFKLDLRQQESKKFFIHAGLHLFRLQSQGSVVSDSVGSSKYVWISFLEYNPQQVAIFNQKMTLLSPYWNLKLTQRFWQTQIGMRLPTNLQNKTKIRIEPRLAVTIMPISQLDFTFAGGLYHQFTDRSYATEAKSGDAIGAGEYVVRANADQPSVATHWRSEVSYHPRPAWEMSVAFFRFRIKEGL